MGIMGRKYCLLTMLVILGAFIHVSKAKSQEVHKYKCVALYNHGEEWPVEKLYYYVEFNGNSLTRWQWKDGEWKFGKRFELDETFSDGSKVYVAYERIMAGSNGVCTDFLTISRDCSTLKRSYRCPLSEYAFDHYFEEYE